MELTKEYLLTIRGDALENRQKYADMLQQANGAIAMVDFLLQQLDAPKSAEPEKENGDAI